MGASCIKDKSATPKQDGQLGGNGGARGGRPGGPGGQPRNGGARGNGGRPPRNANAKVNEAGCAPVGFHNNNGGKPGGGGGIAAYKPDPEMAKTYFDQISELRRVAIAAGIMPVVRTGKKPPEADANKVTNNSGLVETRRTSELIHPGAVPPVSQSLTVYQCQPLVGDTTIAKGMYSAVHLARLSVFMGPSMAAVSATVPRMPPPRRPSDRSSISFSSEPTSSHNTDSTSLSFVSGPPAADGIGGNLSATLPNSGNAAHYIIAMKEVMMYASYSTSVLLEQIRTEVRHWTRLSAYSPRVLRCYQLEYVFPDNISMAVPEASYHHFPGLTYDNGAKSPKNNATGANGSPLLKALERKRSASGSSSPNLFASFSKRRDANGALSPMSSTMVDSSTTPQKVRLYLEYAKYGTLRGYQIKEMHERFQRRRLHELTARAYMRDVLLALLQIHECGEMQYDLCAKAIFLNQPLHMVYYTYFPAYISDLPTGDLTSVAPSQLGKALGLLDPPPPPPPAPPISASECQKAGLSPQGQRTSNNEPIASVGDGGDEQGDVSMEAHEASLVPQVSGYEIRGDNNGSSKNNRGGSAVVPAGEQRNGNGYPSDGYNQSIGDSRVTPSLSTAISPSPSGAAGATSGTPTKRTYASAGGRGFGKQSSMNSMRTAGAVSGEGRSEGGGNDEGAADHKRLNEIYCRYMEEFDFKRNDGPVDGVPFPSPHDGIEAQADADVIATTILPEEPRETPPLTVVPLQRSNLGGIAIISPDHYVIKPEEDSHTPDLRGRLPMLLTPATHTSAFVCGSPHATAPTCTATSRASNQASGGRSCSPGNIIRTISSGTTTADAAGALGRARGSTPLTKLNHSSLIRRALAYSDADKLEDVPVHKYVTVTHAAPEVLHRRAFSAASDIYAFAMTFLELVTEDGNIMEDCLPEDLPKPKTRREKEEYDAQLAANLDKWYQTRLNALRSNYDAVAREQELPSSVSPRAGPIVVRIPEHLSDEGRNMLRWCLQQDPHKRPTAAELLRSRYFMLGDWIAAPTVIAAEGKETKMPEKPWDPSVNFDAAARAIGLPALR